MLWGRCLVLWWIPEQWLTLVKIIFSTTALLATTYKELIHLLERNRRKIKRMAAFGFGACVIAVAVLDGCVCQGGWPCSLMMAMPAHKPSPGDVCVCVCVIFQDE